MADTKLTEQQVADLATILRSDAHLDAKVQFVTSIKSGIKQHNVPDACVPQLFDGLRSATTVQYAALVNAGFTALNHLLTRLSRQDPKLLAREAARTLPLIIDKLGDPKDKYRALAMQGLQTFYVAAPGEVERFVRNQALGGKNPRAKEGGMQWLLQAHNDHGLQFRSYVPLLMDLLEDADGMVRDAAKNTVIELFKGAPNGAKSDLKKQLKNFKVRPAIEQAIVKSLAPSSSRPNTPAEHLSQPSRPALAASVTSLSVSRPATPSIPSESLAEPVDPVYVNTHRELDDMIKAMAWFFEGRESEQNWLKREESVATLRKLIAGNASSDFQDTMISNLRSMLDAIIKAITSLRTSLSKEGCCLVQDMANAFGPAMDPMVELLMQTMVKLSGGTKKIASQLANVTVDVILSRVTYNNRLMQHIWGACQDKNVQPRLYTAGWMKTVMRKEVAHKNHVEHTGGVDLMEKCLKKGLGDANPGVREQMRSTYWMFWAIWPTRADAIMANLDSTAQKLLNKDPSNPNSPKKSEPASRPGLGLSKSTMATTKPSLRETLMAQKKATLATAKSLPARPGSAMANISPVRTTSSSSTTSTKSTAARPRPEPTKSVNAGGMSVAPMRPVRRRPEMTARPATAGPYSVRDQPSSLEVDSPESLKSRAFTPKARSTPPKRATPRSRPGHAPHASEPNVTSPTVARMAPKPAASPRISPPKLKQSHSALPASSPSRPMTASSPLQPAAPSLGQSISAPLAALSLDDDLSPEPESQPSPVLPSPPASTVPDIAVESEPLPSASRPLEVFEDPFTEDPPTSKPAVAPQVLEERPVNEDAAYINLQKSNIQESMTSSEQSPDKTRQNSRLLDSGIAKVKARSLEVHGFRKLQSLIRDGKMLLADDKKFEALLVGLFDYLEDPLAGTPPDKAQDVKAQILTTVKLLLRKERNNFMPFVSRGLEALLQTRSMCDSRAHIVSGLELLADELVSLGDSAEVVVVLTKRLQDCSDATTEGCRSLTMGLHVLKEMLDRHAGDYVPSDSDVERLASLAVRCIESTDSGVRMDAVQLCVALHARVSEELFWAALDGVKDDPKSLITYYVVKRQREQDVAVPL